MNKYYLLLLLLGCLAGNKVVSQEFRPAIGMRMDSIINVQNGLNTLDIQLSNDTDQDFKGNIKLVLPDGLRSIGERDISVQIKANKKRYLSVRLQSRQLALLKDQKMRVQLYTEDGTLLAQNELHLLVAKNRSVVIMDDSDLQYLKAVGDSVYIKLRILNNGTTDERIQVVLSSPDRLGKREFSAIPVTSWAGQDTTLQVGISVERYMIQLPQFTVRVSGIYDNNDVFGNATISFQNIASSRNFQQMYHTDNMTYNYSRNFVDLQMDQSVGGTRMYVLRSEGTYRAMEGRLRYGLNASQWGDVFTRPNISNTFLEYEKDNKTWTLGNIQENLEASFYGRGATFSVTDSLRDNQFSAGIIERSGDLLGYYGAIGDPGMSAFVRLVLADQDPDRKRYEGQLYYDNNRMDSTQSLLWANSFDLLDKEKAERIQLRGFIAGGVNSYQTNTLAEALVHPSAAFGLKLTGHSKGNFSYSSDNFYSSSYYTGNRRGAIQLTQRINKTSGKGRYGGGLTYSRYDPSYLHSRFATQDNSMFSVDMSYYRSVSPFVSLNLQPSYNNEEASYWMTNERTQLSATSWQLMSSANIRSKNYKHSINTSIETGLIRINGFADKNFILRSNLSYNYGRLGLSALYQHGAFRVFELLNDRLRDESFGSFFTLSSSYGGALFDGKLVWNGNIATYLSSSYGGTYSGNMTTSYRLRRNTILTGGVYYSYTKGHNGYQYDFANLRLGVRQNLKSTNFDRPAVKTGNIHVFCYYDNNHNNIFDSGDEVADDYNFLIGGVNFVTDRRGKAQFKKVPYGSRVLFFPASKGYQGQSRAIDLQSKSISLDIPLQKVTQVKGSLAIRCKIKFRRRPFFGFVYCCGNGSGEQQI
jgi:hypothetical protein